MIYRLFVCYVCSILYTSNFPLEIGLFPSACSYPEHFSARNFLSTLDSPGIGYSPEFVRLPKTDHYQRFAHHPEFGFHPEFGLHSGLGFHLSDRCRNRKLHPHRLLQKPNFPGTKMTTTMEKTAFSPGRRNSIDH